MERSQLGFSDRLKPPLPILSGLIVRHLKLKKQRTRDYKVEKLAFALKLAKGKNSDR
jgi:hypothetical protein